MTRQPFTILIHIALAIIVAGAVCTHFFGITGKMTLNLNGDPSSGYEVTSGPGSGILPFFVQLRAVDIVYYPGTDTPMDFKSHLLIDNKSYFVSMNNPVQVRGWRFYQSAIGADYSVLTLSHDPWGILITYIGYALLGIGMIGFFFQPSTPWRGLLKKRRAMTAGLVLICCVPHGHASPLQTMQKPLASNFGKIYVYWNNRICPMQTMARDVTRTLYGSESYKGMTAEQVLAGWLFYFEQWQRDYLNENNRGEPLKEKAGLIQWLGTGEAFRIYPYHSKNGTLEWLSLTGRRPSGMSLEQWTFMQNAMPGIRALLLQGRNIDANKKLSELKDAQIRYAGIDVLPSEAHLMLERVYNRFARPAIAGIAALLLAGIFLVWPRGRVSVVAATINFLLAAYILSLMVAIGIIGGHVPVSNGPETMLFLGLVAIIASLFVRHNFLVKGCLSTVAGLALLVAAMGSKTPQIDMLMPVLASPLLSLHVMIVMLAYMLFLLMSLLSGIALFSRSVERKEALSVTNRLLLTPAVCLLGAGIFIGAVWANQSWGRYWGWDPKETCALITWIIYAVPIHWGWRRLRCFKRPKVLHRYLLLAILSVLFTYFGANYLLPGLHSYA